MQSGLNEYTDPYAQVDLNAADALTDRLNLTALVINPTKAEVSCHLGNATKDWFTYQNYFGRRAYVGVSFNFCWPGMKGCALAASPSRVSYSRVAGRGETRGRRRFPIALTASALMMGGWASASNPIVPGWYADSEIRVFAGRTGSIRRIRIITGSLTSAFASQLRKIVLYRC